MMKYDFSKILDRNIIFYGVYDTQTEYQGNDDILCSVRKNFFETEKKLKGRDTVKTETDVFRYSYTIANGNVLVWKKLIGKVPVDRVAETSNGYYVENCDFTQRPIKRTYYNLNHIWQKSEIYALDDRFSPLYVLTPNFEDNNPIIIRTLRNKISEKLYPFNIQLDKNLTEKLNILSNEPTVFCKTNQGDFYFCTKEELENRTKVFDKMIKRENDIDTENISETVLETAKEPPAFVINAENLDKNNDNDIFDLSKSEEIHISVKDEITENKIDNIQAEKTVIDNINNNEKGSESEENDNIIPKHSFNYEQGIIMPQRTTTCIFASECPYENIEKQIIESGGKQYLYFGEIENNKRSGRGRTAMKNGETAYEGDYVNDKRDGFGVYYYKSGKLCYTGTWKQNKRNNLGIAFSPIDGSAYIGEWQDNVSVGVGASFDKKGKLIYLGTLSDGKKNGAGITFDENKETFFVGKYKDGNFLEVGTQFTKDGVLVYTGEYKNNVRCGKGTSYNNNGDIIYVGQWFNDVYEGEGTLNLEDGGKLIGNFKNGKAFGKCTLIDKNGKEIYTGNFVDDAYNGTGRLFSDDGAYAEGRFVDGEPTGVFNEYNSDGKLIYSGEWNDMHRNGRGIEYKNGQKVYEGNFLNDKYSGDGKLFENGKLIYTGEFTDGKRNGFGVEFENDKMIYQGLWKDDVYNGNGIVYKNGKAVFAGVFVDGKKNGRINKIQNNKVMCKCLYKDDELTYICEYSEEGSLLYYGNIKDEKKNGMGCSFIPYCEKQFEGIFKDGEPEKPMKVCFKELSELPECKELDNTEYELYRKAPEYIIEKNILGGIFTGKLKDGKPDGKGTILYSDHRYTGIFVDGKPSGEGVIYMRDGKKITGIFKSEPFTDCESIIFANITYYKVNS